MENDTSVGCGCAEIGWGGAAGHAYSCQGILDEMNCACGGPVVSVMGIKRCSVWNKLAGSAVMVPFGQPLPPMSRKRVTRRVAIKH